MLFLIVLFFKTAKNDIGQYISRPAPYSLTPGAFASNHFDAHLLAELETHLLELELLDFS